MMKRLFPSFSGLISMIRGGYVLEDDSNTYYYFGCSKEGLNWTFDFYDRDNQTNREDLITILEKAESENRVFWNCKDESKHREFLFQLGFTNEKVNLEHHGHGVLTELEVMMYHNLPRMQDMIQDRHKNIQFMWNLNEQATADHNYFVNNLSV